MTHGMVEGMPHGKSHVVHLKVWLTISHMKYDAIKGNKGIKKKEGKMRATQMA